MSILCRVSTSADFSAFANDVERLPDRQAAAQRLAEALAKAPESQRQGAARTAMIKCELAARFSQTHREVDARFCEVSELIYQACTTRSVFTNPNQVHA